MRALRLSLLVTTALVACSDTLYDANGKALRVIGPEGGVFDGCQGGQLHVNANAVQVPTWFQLQTVQVTAPTPEKMNAPPLAAPCEVSFAPGTSLASAVKLTFSVPSGPQWHFFRLSDDGSQWLPVESGTDKTPYRLHHVSGKEIIALFTASDSNYDTQIITPKAGDPLNGCQGARLLVGPSDVTQPTRVTMDTVDLSHVDLNDPLRQHPPGMGNFSWFPCTIGIDKPLVSNAASLMLLPEPPNDGTTQYYQFVDGQWQPLKRIDLDPATRIENYTHGLAVTGPMIVAGFLPDNGAQ